MEMLHVHLELHNNPRAWQRGVREMQTLHSLKPWTLIYISAQDSSLAEAEGMLQPLLHSECNSR